MDVAIIPITYNESEEPIVSGRVLHEFLGVGTEYRHWFPRMCEYGFTDGMDYTPVIFDHPKNHQQITDHALKLDMAKELSMIQRSTSLAIYGNMFYKASETI